MKRTLLLTLMLILMTSIQAQDFRQAFGLQIGYANPTLRLNCPDPNISKTQLDAYPMRGLKFGLTYDVTLVRGFGFMMALNYTYATSIDDWEDYKFDIEGRAITNGIYPLEVKYRNDFHQLEIAVDWQYKFEIAQDTWVILYSGPTIQCIARYDETQYLRDKVSYMDHGKTILAHMENPKEGSTEFYKRFNVTWGIGAGFQYDRYVIRGGYDFGLINPYSYDNYVKLGFQDRNTRGRLDQWQIKLGIFLWDSEL